jgi:hypothetical protein
MTDPRSVVQALMAGMDARRFADIVDLVSDDHRFVLNDRETVGRDALAGNFARWFGMVPDSRTKIRQLVVEDDVVVVHFEVSGTRMRLPDEELTGPWSFPACAICTVKDGLVTEWREFSAWDTPEKLAALIQVKTETETDAGAV